MRLSHCYLIGLSFMGTFFAANGQSISGQSFAENRLEQAAFWLQLERAEEAQELAKLFLNHEQPAIRQRARHLEVLTAIALSEKNALDLVAEFAKDYPAALASNEIFFKVGYSYFKLGQYASALPWFKKVSVASLQGKAAIAFNFSYGYSRFAVKDYKGALPLLALVKEDLVYGKQAQYYIGYMAYESGDNQTAKDVFLNSDIGAVSGEKNTYYLADIFFKEGDFNLALKTAKAYLPLATGNETSQINKIIGESYFELADYKAAIPFLQAYRGERRRWAPEDYYKLGYSFYFVADYENAIDQFNKIIQANTSLAQNAYYYLGAAYLKKDQKQPALNAFKKASELNFNDNIAKEAALNFAKLSYEVGNPYQAIPIVLKDFITSYPNAPETKELKALLLNAYLLEKDYKGALVFLESTPSLSAVSERQEISKMAAFFALENNENTEALAYLDLLISLGPQTSLAAEALFWKAEIYIRTYKYDLAFKTFNLLDPIKNKLSSYLQTLLSYQKAYTFFKTKDYVQAIDLFKEFEKTVGNKQDFEAPLGEALVRTADAYYTLGNFSKAIEYYKKTVTHSPSLKPYATFNMAMAYGLGGDIAMKIQILESFKTVSVSPIFYPKALLELAEAYTSQDKVSPAIATFDSLTSLFPASALVPTAQLKKGLLLYNQSETTEALVVFKEVARRFPKSAEFSQALMAAKRIFLEQGNVQEYISWTNTLGLSSEPNENLDQESYTQLIRRAPSLETSKQIKLYESYLDNFPSGTHVLAVNFLLAQAYTADALFAKALPLFQWVADAQSENSEAALVAMLQIKTVHAIGGDPTENFKALLSLAAEAENRNFAASNLMRISYEKKDFKSLEKYAQQVLALENLESAIKLDAQIMLARMAQEKGETAAAIKAYTSLKEVANGALAAESLYWLAFYKQQEKEYEASNELVQALAQQYAIHREWAAKALLLMAENFYAQDDLFQATFIWQNIIDNFSQFPNLIEIATKRLKETNALAKTPE